MSVSRPDGKKLDELWANVVKERQGYRCEYCGLRGRMEAAHVVGRRHRATRWGIALESFEDPEERDVLKANAILDYDLCGHCLCHTHHQEYDEHGPLEVDIIQKVVGTVRKPLLQAAAKKRVAKYQCYEEIKLTLEKIRDELDKDVPLSVRRA